jgi:hypothetical protein
MIMEAILARDFTAGGSTTGASLTIAASGSFYPKAGQKRWVYQRCIKSNIQSNICR